MGPTSLSDTAWDRMTFLRRWSCELCAGPHGAASRSRPPGLGPPSTCALHRAEVMAKPAAPGLQVRRWSAGQWTESPDAVVTEEPLQLMLDGVPLSVVMRTPGHDVELCVGLMFAEGIVRSMTEVRLIRISAEAGEHEERVHVDADLVESNEVVMHLAGAARRKPAPSMLMRR